MTVSTYSDTIGLPAGLGLSTPLRRRRGFVASLSRTILRVRVGLAMSAVRADLKSMPTFVLNDIGIPADEIDAVFDELARGRNARDRAGSGLGLALVRTIVDRHGGEVTIASREGDGTRVRLALPAAG